MELLPITRRSLIWWLPLKRIAPNLQRHQMPLQGPSRSPQRFRPARPQVPPRSQCPYRNQASCQRWQDGCVGTRGWWSPGSRSCSPSGSSPQTSSRGWQVSSRYSAFRPRHRIVARMHPWRGMLIPAEKHLDRKPDRRSAYGGCARSKPGAHSIPAHGVPESASMPCYVYLRLQSRRAHPKGVRS